MGGEKGRSMRRKGCGRHGKEGQQMIGGGEKVREKRGKKIRRLRRICG